MTQEFRKSGGKGEDRTEAGREGIAGTGALSVFVCFQCIQPLVAGTANYCMNVRLFWVEPGIS